YREFHALLEREMAAPAEETTDLFRRLREETRARARAGRQGSRGAGEQRDRGAEEWKSGRVEAPDRIVHPSTRPLVHSSAARLPLPLTQLIGREEDIRQVMSRLSSSRLVTLTGTGG